MDEQGVKFLLDSVILIDHFNGIPQASAYLEAARRDAGISVITRAEVLTGFPPEHIALAKRFLEAFSTLAIDKEAADSAAVLRREYGWKLPDAFQAALAKQHGLQLVTRNSRDFPPERHAFVLIPYCLP